MSGRSIWATLGLAQTRDRTAIRRAYAARLKVTNPEDDPEGFQALRRAYEMALARAAAPEATAPVFDWEDEHADPDPDIDVRLEVSQDQGLDPAAPGPSAKPEATDHERALRALQHAVASGQPPAALLSALEVVLASPDLDQLGVFVHTEAWLAQVIARNLPATDPLIAPSIARFGWKVSDSDRTVMPWVTEVVSRGTDLRHLAAFRQRGNPMRVAVGLLDVAPTSAVVIRAALVPGRLSEVRNLINQIETHHPSLAMDFPPGAFEAWREAIARPRIPVVGLWLILVLSAVPALVVDIGRHPANGGADADFLRYWLEFALAGFGLLILKWALIDKPRYLWPRLWQARAPGWVKLGWAPLGLALLAASQAVAPPWTLAVTGVVGAAVTAWSAIVGQAFDRDSRRWPWGLRLAVRNVPLGVVWVTLAFQDRSLALAQGAIAAMAAALAQGLGEKSLVDFWRLRVPRSARIAADVALMLGGVGIFVVAAWQGMRPSAGLVTAISALALVHRLPDGGGAPFAFKFPFGRIPIGLFLLPFVAGGALASVLAALVAVAAVISPWLVTFGIVVDLAIAVGRELSSRAPKRRRLFTA